MKQVSKEEFSAWCEARGYELRVNQLCEPPMLEALRPAEVTAFAFLYERAPKYYLPEESMGS